MPQLQKGSEVRSVLRTLPQCIGSTHGFQRKCLRCLPGITDAFDIEQRPDLTYLRVLIQTLSTKLVFSDMRTQSKIRFIALVLFFAFCQVIGTMCALPDLSLAEDTASLIEAGMVCPMDGTNMCPPSLTSSPERQVRSSMVSDIDQASMLLSIATTLMAHSVSTPWSGSNACSIVPISIASSSVLRI